ARGSTRMPLLGDEGAAWLRQTLGELVATPAEPGALEATVGQVQALFAGGALPDLVGAPGERRPLILDQGWLYSQKLHAHEVSFVAAARARLAATPAPAFAPERVDAALEAVRARPSVVGGQVVLLSDEQEAAVRRAALAPLTVVSGGPGTGKTSIVVTILRVLARLGVEPSDVALA